MKNLEKYRIFAPELRCSLHIAKYRNEQKSARFHIVTYLLAELKKRLKISIFLWRKSCASR